MSPLQQKIAHPRSASETFVRLFELAILPQYESLILSEYPCFPYSATAHPFHTSSCSRRSAEKYRVLILQHEVVHRAWPRRRLCGAFSRRCTAGGCPNGCADSALLSPAASATITNFRGLGLGSTDTYESESAAQGFTHENTPPPASELLHILISEKQKT